MNKRIALVGVFAVSAAMIAWPNELLAFGQALQDTVIESYVVRFVDATTWAFSCL